MSECFHIQLRKHYKLLHILQSASRFESVLLAAIKALQASAQAMQGWNVPFPLYLCFLLNKFRMRLHMLCTASMQF
jgi:hypothetical protein